MYLFDEAEASTTMVLYRYLKEHRGAAVTCEMPDGLVFKGVLDTAYESDTEDWPECENGDMPVREYFAVLLKVEEVVHAAGESDHMWRPGDLFEVNYLRFPARITDDKGTVICSEEERL